MIGLLGSSFLCGLVLGCCTIARAGDIYGRKIVFSISILVLVIVSLLFLVSTNVYIDFALLLVVGWAVTGKQYVGYSYLLEIQPVKNQVAVGTAFFMYEAFIYLMICFYFYFISNRWEYLFIPSIGSGIVGIVLFQLLPESPRFLVSINRFDKARS